MRSLLVLVVMAAGTVGPWDAEAATGGCEGGATTRGRDVQCERESGPLPGVVVGGASESRLPNGWSVDFVYVPGVGGVEEPWASRTPCDPVSGASIAPGETLPDDPSFFGIVLIRDGSGALASSEGGCYGSGTGAPAWLPPTRAEIERALAEAPWPASTTGVDPTVEGLTGLETHLWSTTVAAQPISVTIGASTVVGTATPVVYRWFMGDGATATSTHPGSAETPAATHVYETKGAYEIVLEIEWQADVEVVTTLPSGAVLSFQQDPPLAPVTIAGSRDYPVVEVRSILVPNER